MRGGRRSEKCARLGLYGVKVDSGLSKDGFGVGCVCGSVQVCLKQMLGTEVGAQAQE